VIISLESVLYQELTLYFYRMKIIKRLFKANTRNFFFKALAGFGRSIYRFYENRNHDIFSNGEVYVLKQLSHLNPKIILDVGANIGNWGREAAHLCQSATIYCFEPVPATFDKLNSMIQSEHIANIKTIMKGIYSKTTNIQINQFISSDEHASLYDVKGAGYITSEATLIDLINGDEFLNAEKFDFVDFVKLDIEGAEMDALQGFVKSIKKRKIRMIQFEYGYINITTKNLLLDYYEFFEEYGYILGKLYPKHVEFRKYSFKDEDFIGPNYIAIRNDDDELKALLT